MSAHAKKALDILHQFGDRITSATSNSIVPAKRLAGFIGVECAYDPRTGRFGEGVPRFESAHYAALIALRDKGAFVDSKGRRRTSFSGVTRADIADASDAAIRALASSWGPAQIMGWHCVHDLSCSVADLKNPAHSLTHVVNLLILMAKPYILAGDWGSVLRIWNTGLPDGNTHNATYVEDAEKIAEEYQKLLVGVPQAPKWSVGLPVTEIPSADAEEKTKPLPPVEDPAPVPDPITTVTSSTDTATAVAVNQATPPAGDLPDAPATKVTTNTGLRWALGGLSSASLMAFLGWVKDNANAIVVGSAIICIFLLVLMFRAEVKAALRQLIFSDPNRKNVE